VLVNDLTEAIIGAAIEVHRTIGPGLQESAYVQCLCHELNARKLPFVMEQPLPILYKDSSSTAHIGWTWWLPTP
jgi:GxxExxY protein